MAHRDYYDKGGRITVELFNDHIEISNPGGLVSAISKSEFSKRSLSRNPLIFDLLERMRMVEQIGYGIARMRDLMQEEHLITPEFNIDGISTVTYRGPFDLEKRINRWAQKLTSNGVKILTEKHANSKISKREQK